MLEKGIQMIKELVKDDAILSQVCEQATPEDAELAQDLIDTAASLEDCSCLAANQIGVTKAVFVYFDDDQKPHVMYNPKVLMGLRPSKTVEGCLSHDDFSKVTRYAKINGVDEAAMQAVFAAIDQRYKTREAYLAEEFGLDATRLAELRDYYLV